MNASLLRLVCLGAILCPLALSTGCKKKAEAPPPIQIDLTVPPPGGGVPVTQVTEALGRQDYDAVVAGILAAQRQELNAQDQEAIAEAQRQLLEASAHSAAAAEAYRNLSRIRHGR